jgi:large subunit ribosomal protein L22
MSTTATKPYHATHRFARISVRKVRPLLDLIRGHFADDALDVLKYMPHRGARLIEQVLKSAMANAEEKGIRNVGELVVSDARGDGGPMFKRLMPRARGMAYSSEGGPRTSPSACPPWRIIVPIRKKTRTRHRMNDRLEPRIAGMKMRSRMTRPRGD